MLMLYRSMMRHNAGVMQDVRLKLRPAARASYKLALTDDPSNRGRESVSNLTVRRCFSA